MGKLTIAFVDRSMDYVRRQLELLAWASKQLKDNEEAAEFRHVKLAIPTLARFMEGSDTFMIFEREALNRFVSDQLSAGTWNFFIGMQQYVFAGFDEKEVSDIIDQLAFAIAPTKIMGEAGLDRTSPITELTQNPAGSSLYENTPKEIKFFLNANPWLAPIVALSMSRDIPTFEDDEDGK